MKKSVLTLMFFAAATATLASAEETYKQCVDRNMNEMMAETRKMTSDSQVLSMMEDSLRENVQKICREETANRNNRPAPITPAPQSQGTGIGLGRRVPQSSGTPSEQTTSAQETDHRSGDSTPGTGERNIAGDGLSASGDIFNTRTKALVGSYEFRSGFTDHSVEPAEVTITVTVINKTKCDLATDGSLYRDWKGSAPAAYAPFSFSGVTIRPFGTFRKDVKVHIPSDSKKHSISGNIFASFLHNCPGK